MLKGLQETVRENKSSVFELPGVNRIWCVNVASNNSKHSILIIIKTKRSH